MALPTPDKTWQFTVNQIKVTSGTLATDCKTMLLAIKNALIGMSSNPWTVTGSSDGSTAGMDTVDRWSDTSKLVWGTSAHSWITLKQTGISSNFEICLDCSNAQAYNMTIVVGLSGFTGGSTTARPTATTSITTLSNTTWLYGNNTVLSTVLHAMQSTDGQCTRIVVGYNSGPVMFWLFDVPKNPVSGWTNPSIFFTVGGGTAWVTGLTYFNDTARINGYANSTAFTAFATCEGAVSSTLPEWIELQRPNQINGEQHIFPIGLVSETTGAKGRHGQIFDMWWGNLNNNSIGGGADATYPNTSTRTLWQCDDIILPWSGLVSPPGPLPKMVY